MRTARIGFLALFAFFTLVIFSPAWSLAAEKKTDKVLAKIGEKTFTQRDIDSRILLIPPEYQERFKTEAQKKELLEILIQGHIIALEAKVEKINRNRVIREKIEDTTNSILAQEYMRRKFSKAPEVTEAETNKFYAEHMAEFVNPAMVRAQHILIKVDKGAKPEDDKAALEKIKGIRKELDAPGADFAKLAEKYSDDTASKNNGGDVGFFTKERMVPEFSKAAFDLKVGTISEPVKTAYGYHLIKVTETKPETPMESNEAKARIRSQLENQQRQDIMQREIIRLKKKYRVEYK